MSIAFESEEVQLQKLRERLRLMSDGELVKFGEQVRGLSELRAGVTSARASCNCAFHGSLMPTYLRFVVPDIYESGCR